MNDITPRKPAGTPAGGEFASKTGTAPVSSLTKPHSEVLVPPLDLDGFVGDPEMAGELESIGRDAFASDTVEAALTMLQDYDLWTGPAGVRVHRSEDGERWCEASASTAGGTTVTRYIGELSRVLGEREANEIRNSSSSDSEAGRRLTEAVHAAVLADLNQAAEQAALLDAALAARDYSRGGSINGNVGVFSAAQYEHAPPEVLDALDVIQVGGVVIRSRGDR